MTSHVAVFGLEDKFHEVTEFCNAYWDWSTISIRFDPLFLYKYTRFTSFPSPVLVTHTHKKWTNVESSTLVSSMLFNPDYPMYVLSSWTITQITDTALWKRRIYVERQ